ncbi:hypothetical protein D187_008572 [Cystobacter fuscus DSM 2262]|uniref:Uncharacterized protein n=1 Tax=Cystobacter fuscus (strain ATCC 25194 / DSM 2262 / NBRC 100088 / M29) TaxID=1242864 RepID=S9QM63_CYSF2|nr:hypothetical protein D187_008572 [Cystobacter fuscus DSM 2262]
MARKASPSSFHAPWGLFRDFLALRELPSPTRSRYMPARTPWGAPTWNRTAVTSFESSRWAACR